MRYFLVFLTVLFSGSVYPYYYKCHVMHELHYKAHVLQTPLQPMDAFFIDGDGSVYRLHCKHDAASLEGQPNRKHHTPHHQP